MADEGAKGLTAQVNTLSERLRTQDGQAKAVNRKLDILRRLVQVATAVVMALLVMLWFIDHPDFAPSTKQPVLGALFIICLAYILALEIGRGSTGVVIFLVASGVAISMYSLGWATCAMHRYLF
jgi:hypothetical protein